jgi:biopolymer transport protein ExbB/TolQ
MFENFDWVGAMRSSPVMIVILFCSVLTVGFAIERLYYYTKRRGNPDNVLATALIAVRGGNREEAVRVCAASTHPFGPVAAEMLRSADLPPEAAEEKLQIVLSEQRMELERNLGFLGTMGNTAPLIGLLGTVWGIMRAFHDMARTGSAGPSVWATGAPKRSSRRRPGLGRGPGGHVTTTSCGGWGNLLTVAENHARTLRIESNRSASRPARRRKETLRRYTRGKRVPGDPRREHDAFDRRVAGARGHLDDHDSMAFNPNPDPDRRHQRPYFGREGAHGTDRDHGGLPGQRDRESEPHSAIGTLGHAPAPPGRERDQDRRGPLLR